MQLANKNVLVTGGAGFIGSTVVRELLNQHANVIVLDNFISGHPDNLIEVKDKIKLIEGDIRDERLTEFFKNDEIEYIFNLAAHPYIPECYERPREFFDVDAKAVLNLLLCAQEAGVKRIIQYSTSEVYGTAKHVPMDEHHPVNPMSTYAVSKLAADRLCYTMFHERQVPVIILRQFNVYGPRETHPYVIPEIIKQLDKGNALKLGNIKASRDLTYVTDAAKGAIELMKADKAVGDVFNMGSGEEWTVEELAHTLGEIMGHKNIQIEVDKARLRPLDVERLNANYFKMHKLTDWRPTVKLKEGLQKTIDFFNENGKTWLWEKNFAKEEEMWHKKLDLELKKKY